MQKSPQHDPTTADMRFHSLRSFHPNCSLRSQLLISANVIRNRPVKDYKHTLLITISVKIFLDTYTMCTYNVFQGESMKNITLSIDEDTLNAGREYAKKHHISFNALIRRLIKQTIQKESGRWIEESFKFMDEAKANSEGKKWKREDLYRV